jgi:MYXO-CTERM domain-containing protein
MYWNITARHDAEEAVWRGPIERTRLEGAIYQDDPVPHDQDFRFDIYCPEDVSTCDIIRKATAKITAKIGNPDPKFTGACFEPRVTCGDECILLDSSPDHCGACDNECGQGESCKAGVCQARENATWDDSSPKYSDDRGCSLVTPASKGAPRPWLAWLALALGLSLVVRRRRA